MNEIVKVENGEITVAQEVVKKIIEFEKLKKEMKYQEELLKEGLMEAMQKLGKKSFIIDGLSITMKKATTKTTIDSQRLKEECPEIFKTYSKTSEVKSSLTLTVAD